MGIVWKKGKGPITVILLVVLLHFSRGQERFCPVILLDMFLRIPGDILLRLIQLPVSSTIYQVLRGLFQLGTALLIWGLLVKLGLGRSKTKAHPKPEKATSNITVNPESNPVRGPGHQFSMKILAVILLTMIILNSRCGLGIAGIVNFVTGVVPYPLRAETLFTVENLKKEQEVPERNILADFFLRHQRYLREGTVHFFPEQGAESIVNFLESLNLEEVKDSSIIGDALEVLWLTDIKPVHHKLYRMLINGQTCSGYKLSEYDVEKLAGLLVRTGDRSALDFFMKNYKLKRGTVWDWYEKDLVTEPGIEAVEIQDFLIRKFRNPFPLVSPGFPDRLRFGYYQEGLEVLEFWQVEKLALDFLNAFCDWFWDERANATLVVSPDGGQVSYDLEIFYYRGPLAAAGSPYSVHLMKANGGWLIKKVSSGPSWIS